HLPYTTLFRSWIYGKMTAAQYEASYSSYFGENFWTMDMGTDDEGNAMTFEDYAKEQIISRIKQIIVLNNHAEKAGASLTEEEEEQCAQYAAAFAEDTTGAEILAECGATEDDMTEIYEENALAAKVQEYMIKRSQDRRAGTHHRHPPAPARPHPAHRRSNPPTPRR